VSVAQAASLLAELYASPELADFLTMPTYAQLAWTANNIIHNAAKSILPQSTTTKDPP
jgi:hypothetical protein